MTVPREETQAVTVSWKTLRGADKIEVLIEKRIYYCIMVIYDTCARGCVSASTCASPIEGFQPFALCSTPVS